MDIYIYTEFALLDCTSLGGGEGRGEFLHPTHLLILYILSLCQPIVSVCIAPPLPSLGAGQGRGEFPHPTHAHMWDVLSLFQPFPPALTHNSLDSSLSMVVLVQYTHLMPLYPKSCVCSLCAVCSVCHTHMCI